MFVIAVSMSVSEGCGFFASSAAAAMIWPDWQYPHCGTSSAIQARCTACERLRDRPSIVVTRLPATAATGSTQVRVATRTCVLPVRSEEHTSELQSRLHLVCRLLLEKKTRTSLSCAGGNLAAACGLPAS